MAESDELDDDARSARPVVEMKSDAPRVVELAPEPVPEVSAESAVPKAARKSRFPRPQLVSAATEADSPDVKELRERLEKLGGTFSPEQIEEIVAKSKR
jgi:hypothetical protein